MIYIRNRTSGAFRVSWFWRAVLIVSILAGVVAASAGGAFAAWKVWTFAVGDPHSSAGEVLWTRSDVAGEPLGSWVSSDSLIVARRDSLTAYRRDDGETAWRAGLGKLSTAPEADALCGMSREPGEGRGVVAYGITTGDDEVSCTGIALIDLRTGEPIWQRALPHDPAPGVRTAFAAVRVLATWGDHFLAVNVRDGAEMWRRTTPEGCHPNGPAFGRTIVVPMVCDDGDRYLQLLSAADGARTASTSLRGVVGDPMAISADPPGIVDDATEPTSVDVFDGSAQHIGRLRLGPPDGVELEDGMDGRADILPYTDAPPGFPERYPFAVWDGKLVVTIDEGELISAYDMRENESLTTISSPHGRVIRPIGVTDEGVVFAGPGEMGVFTHVRPNRFDALLGRIERVSAVGDDLHWADDVLYGVSAEAPHLYAVSRAP